ncbi:MULTISPECIES: aldo/keto reductase [Bacillus]|uniref:aldo/keto reductase n=1 Tax=Bacillus TaxID=1386 RepID=UPI000B5DB39D|nr:MULTISPECIES: aldo/keto reductase [Bacillus]OXB96824.1 oxidoreductase [Bacillus sp. M13(2017)]QCY64956.1 aldo/keto reductase [Bacillus thuringiensis]
MKLALGTVQLGLHYGIGNIMGKPDREEALNIIKYAINNGIDVLDTASSYGNSEVIIGEYVSSKTTEKNFQVVTKIPMIDSENIGIEHLDSLIDKYIKQSMMNLKTNIIDCCLLHDSKNMVSHNGYIIQKLNTLKLGGVIKKIGVSVYTPDEVKRFLEFDCFDMIQVPLNIFDQRLICSGLLQKLKTKGIEIHARSPYLQGLLLMDTEKFPDYLQIAKKPIKEFEFLAREFNLSRAQLALLFVRELKEVDKIIIGCETVDQLKENIQICNSPLLEEKVLNTAKKLFKDIPEIIINPNLWRVNNEST